MITEKFEDSNLEPIDSILERLDSYSRAYKRKAPK